MRRALASVAALALTPGAALAQSHAPGGWAALATDRTAAAVGDLLTVLIFENATASNAARNDAQRDNSLSGAFAAGSIDEAGRLALGSRSRGGGETLRSGRMAGQISVTVEAVFGNGDLRIAGEQYLRINGEATRIRLRGRVRRADILADNRIVSSRIADAEIDYDGRGFVSRSAKPGLLGAIFGFLGL